MGSPLLHSLTFVLGALVACCIASCEESRQDAESNSFFGEYEEIFGTVLKCLTEETESIQNAAFSALKEVISWFSETAHRMQRSGVT